MTVLVLGADGWLGSHYVGYFKPRMLTYGYGHRECDITDIDQVRDTLDEINPDVVINCAGKTHSVTIPNIDGCIESLEARNQTILVNVVGAGNVAQACAERRIKLVHIGSGCIFNGYDRVFTEESEPNPPSFYAQTKLDGDRAVLARAPGALVLRIRMPISAIPHPRNLITKLAKAKQVVDVQNTITVLEDLLPFTENCLRLTGIVHAVQTEPLYFRDLMRWYRELVDGEWNGEFIPANQYKTKDGR
jgi:dTDP-4-dehydrorhamnose reductase